MRLDPRNIHASIYWKLSEKKRLRETVKVLKEDINDKSADLSDLRAKLSMLEEELSKLKYEHVDDSVAQAAEYEELERAWRCFFLKYYEVANKHPDDFATWEPSLQNTIERFNNDVNRLLGWAINRVMSESVFNRKVH